MSQRPQTVHRPYDWETSDLVLLDHLLLKSAEPETSLQSLIDYILTLRKSVAETENQS
jgi:hypothetical protein